IYQYSSLGSTLIDAFDDLVTSGQIPEPLAHKLGMAVLRGFDNAMASPDLWGKAIKSKMKFSGVVRDFNYWEHVWSFRIKAIKFKMDDGEVVEAENVKAV
ncbi:hypothetical protein B0H66DRAFT_464127, partial [Apodospora peruviana]